MKKTIIFLAVLMVFLPALAQEKQPDAERQKAMEAYMKAGAVTENHEFLKKYAGAWDCQVKGWSAPGQPPMVSHGSFVGEMILDGRFLLMNFKGEMFGQPFAGLQIIGFDNLQQKYVTLWIDNGSTFFFTTTGTRQGGVISESGLWPDPLTGAQAPVKARTTWIGADEYLYEQFMVMPDKSEFKSMEMTCKRVEK
jgi:hypothetical protein